MRSSNYTIDTHTHTKRKKSSFHTTLFPFTTHTQTHNYELMRPERKNEGHVQLEMKQNHHPFASLYKHVQQTQIEKSDT